MRPIPPEILGSRSLPRVRIDRLTPESPTKAPRPRTQGPDAARRWRPTARRRWCGLALGTGQSGVRRWSRCGRRCGTRAQDNYIQGDAVGSLEPSGGEDLCTPAGAAPAGRAPSSHEAPVHQALFGDWRLPRPRSGRRYDASCNPLAWLSADRLGSSWIRLSTRWIRNNLNASRPRGSRSVLY